MSNATSRTRSRKAGAPAHDESANIRQRGWTDASEMRDYPREYDTWKRGLQITYERGRHQFAAVNHETNGNAPRWDRRKLLATVLQSAGIDSEILRQFKTNALPYADRKA